ncbi:MAG: 23S rRNA pseudouridine(1911/1915/1917) synthase RluD [Pseudomonadales bacterium]|nr:23S rRNA pseudouridine(1911/1915/1917) synthase RluD [Pseudomonadales bacterium]
MQEMIEHEASVPNGLSKKRFDQVAVALFPEYSRSRLQYWIESGELTLDGMTQKPKFKVPVDGVLKICAAPDQSHFEPQDISLDVVFEDDDILVINKPAGLVVHPGAGNFDGTLLNGLLYYCSTLEAVPRAGIVHRLDKDTTGLMVVAKTLVSQNNLVHQLQSREVKRIYHAIAYGDVARSGSVDAPIGRHSTMRTRMSVQLKGKEAMTHYQPIRNFGAHTYLELSLSTGRTHQIRVHMQHINHPLVGDPVYGGTLRIPAGSPSERLVSCLSNFPRQALHAKRLCFDHPAHGEMVEFEIDLPDDFAELVYCLSVEADEKVAD